MASLEDELAKLPEARRAKVDARAAELIAEEMTLRDLRRALDRTQVAVARKLGVKQETVSRLEQRSDMLLSTLRSYVEAMGGELDLVAKFPGRPVVRLKALASVEHRDQPDHDRPRAPASERKARRGPVRDRMRLSATRAPGLPQSRRHCAATRVVCCVTDSSRSRTRRRRPGGGPGAAGSRRAMR